MDRIIPQPDAEALGYLRKLARHLKESPAAYAISQLDGDNLFDRVEAFGTALDVSLDESTRTPLAVRNKDMKRAEAEELARLFIRNIKPNEGVSIDAKTAAGIPLPTVTPPTPRPAPNSWPNLEVVAATRGAQTVQWRDSLQGETKARPFGVKAMQLFVAVSDAAVSNPDDAKYYAQYGRGPVAVEFDEADDGKVATYFARWISSRNEEGPWSGPRSMRIAA